MPRCSIIIPVYGRATLTRQCLDSLLAPGSLPRDTEIVVVDDGSRDGTSEVLAAYGTRIRVVTHPMNTGFAIACNDGATVASGEFLVFLNNDVIPRRGWLERLVDHARGVRRLGAVGSRLLFPNGTIQNAGIVFGIDRLPHAIYTGFPGDHPAVMKSRRFRAVTGACLLVPRDAFDDLDGFDPAFRNTYEDVDFCLRLEERGREVHYCHESVLVHLFAQSRDARHLYGGPLRDIEHTERQFLARWARRIDADEIRYYAEDGLLGFVGNLYPRVLSVSPLLAASVTATADASRVDRLLAERSRQVFALGMEKTALERRIADLETSPSPEKLAAPDLEQRAELSHRFVHGAGIEIGALHSPLPVDPGTIVRYVDRFSSEELRRHYPELAALPLVEPDIIDDGERLTTIADDSQDFVVANHFLEHCQDPIGALTSLLRVTRIGGIIYLALPDKRFTFDRRRPVTSVDHVIRDHEQGPAGSRTAHFEEWVALAEDDNIRGRSAAELMEMDYSIHFHVWTVDGMLELLGASKSRFGLSFETEVMVRHGIEVIFILRKLPTAAHAGPV